MTKEKEICWACGQSVAQGSGRFVNRVPSLNTVAERKETGCKYPEGGWLCAECDEKATKTEGIEELVQRVKEIMENVSQESYLKIVYSWFGIEIAKAFADNIERSATVDDANKLTDIIEKYSEEADKRKKRSLFPTLIVNQEEFGNWYFNDKTEDKEVVCLLISEGKVSLLGILEDVGYLPVSFVKNSEAINADDIVEDEIESPGSIYNFKFEEVKDDNKKRKN
jgi:hypothetical protein